MKFGTKRGMNWQTTNNAPICFYDSVLFVCLNQARAILCHTSTYMQWNRYKKLTEKPKLIGSTQESNKDCYSKANMNYSGEIEKGTVRYILFIGSITIRGHTSVKESD